MKYIYLDNNATTKVDSQVLKAMLPFFTDKYANPSSVHQFGIDVSNELLKARETIARKINCKVKEIIFTASGSEADNLCIKGYCIANKNKGNHIITSSIEHPAVLNSCKALEKLGYKITYIDVNKEGFIDPKDIDDKITKETILVSIMHANNEIGTIQPIEEISKICIQKRVAFHTDAVQSFLKMPLDVKKLNLTLASFSGHKIHAPKGIGFAFIKEGTEISKLIDGGGQEYKLRAGTENSVYIIGLAKAVELSSDGDIRTMKKMQKYVMDKLKQLDSIRINGPENLNKRVCNNINFSSKNVTGEIILSKLSDLGICVSTGSACSSQSTKVSSVLQAIDCPSEFIHGNIRVSISKFTTYEELDIFVKELNKILSQKLIEFNSL